MRTSIYIGEQLSKLDFDYIANLRFYGRHSNNSIENKLEDLVNLPPINYIFYCIEKGIHGEKHIHLMIKCNCKLEFKNKIQEYVQVKRKTVNTKRKLLKCYEESNYIDKYEPTQYTKLTGKKMEFYYEEIKSKKGASLYNTKQTDRGLNYNYLINKNYKNT